MRTESEVLDYLRKVAREELKLPQQQIDSVRPETPIVEGLQLDSLAQVVLLSKIETDFGLVFEPEDRERLQTVGDLVRALQVQPASKDS